MYKDASPAQQLSYAMFKLEENDFPMDQTTMSLRRREISPRDPFLGKKPRFRQLHYSVYNTEELLEKLEPYESRRFTNEGVVKDMCDLEARFYKSKE